MFGSDFSNDGNSRGNDENKYFSKIREVKKTIIVKDIIRLRYGGRTMIPVCC